MKSLFFLSFFAVAPSAWGEPPLPDPDTQAAQRHFMRGLDLYNHQLYDEACHEFETAQRIKNTPSFDFNLGRCLERAERWQDAADAYARYFETLVAGSEADMLRERIHVLKARVRSASSSKAMPQLSLSPALSPSPTHAIVVSAPPTIVPPPSFLERHRRSAFVVAGGVALLVGSLAAGLVADARYSDLRAACAPDGACAPEAQQWIDSGRSAGITSDVFLGAGVATVAAGVALFFVERQGWRVSPSVSGHGGGFVLEFVR